jgi:Alpha/beta hydrolase domain
VPNPTVIGPVPASVPPGDPAHDYPYFSTQFDIYSQGYVEEEFFLEGTANRYSVVNRQLTTATLIDSGHPYKTRMVVRRPADSRKFNGTAVVEWYNVTVGFDVEANWFRYHEEIVRAGYAWIGVSAQRVGVNFLKTWSPSRYGTLDVTQGGTINNDALNWDIYSQALQAIRHPEGENPLGNLNVERVIADGESSSASKLTQYYNAIHPLAGLADAFILNGAPEPNLVVRTDLATPVFKLLTETDVAVIGHAQNRQDDSDVLRSWEVAGTSHADYDMIGVDVALTGPGVNPVQWRDTGTFQAPSCDFPTLSRVPYKYVYHAVLEHVDRWIAYGVQPPHAPRLEVVSLSGGPRGAELARDSFGIAKGGIRLAAVDVPTATNGSPNGPGFFCSIFGQYRPFDAATLASLYPTHGSYVSKVAQVTDESVRDGFVLRPDAQTIKGEASHSTVGK